jgi:hypothetical protein
MASAVSLSIFLTLNRQAVPQTLHRSVVLAFKIRNLAVLKSGGCICEIAKRRMDRSTCWSSPTLTVTSVTSFNFSFSATSFADVKIASAKAHSCIKLLTLRIFKKDIANKTCFQEKTSFTFHQGSCLNLLTEQTGSVAESALGEK